MAKTKYVPRINEFRGEHRIKEKFIKENFGEDYILIWTGHNHFAKNIKNDQLYYIFKREKRLLPVELYSDYFNSKIQKKI